MNWCCRLGRHRWTATTHTYGWLVLVCARCKAVKQVHAP